MSQVKVSSIVDTSGGNTVTINGYTPTMSNMAGRNRIINGDMRIDQRNNGASVTANDGVFPVDRFKFQMSQASKGTGQQSSISPAGFTKSLLFTSSSAYSVAAGESFNIRHIIEGFNGADLGFGTANAQTVTISFWVRSSLTGTFGGSLSNQAWNRAYPFTFAISAADTWEYKTVTIAGDTTGTWNTDNSGGLNVWFGLGVGTTRSGTAGAWAGSDYRSATGATSVVGTSGATFYITGVQLEAGSVATPFERRPYGTELALCQRYYYRLTPHTAANFTILGVGYNTSTTSAVFHGSFPVSMRTNPTSLEQSGTAANYSVGYLNNAETCTAVPTFSGTTTANNYRVIFTTGGSLTAGQGSYGASTNTLSGFLAWSAEL